PTSNGVTTGPHADSRDFVIASGGVLLYASDGGVYQATNPTSTTSGAQVWTYVGGNMSTIETMKSSLDNRKPASTPHDQLGSASQDNAAAERNTSGTWNVQTGGDGTIVAADPISDTRYHRGTSTGGPETERGRRRHQRRKPPLHSHLRGQPGRRR